MFRIEDMIPSDVPKVAMPDISVSDKKYKKMLSTSTSTRKAAADKHFSLAVRYLGAYREFKQGKLKMSTDVTPFVKCATCGKYKPLKHSSPSQGIQCGHFVTREKPMTRFNFYNCNPQCYYCNEMKKGEQAKHAIYIDKLYGVGTSEELMKMGSIRGGKYGKMHYLLVEELSKRIVTAIKKEIIIEDFDLDSLPF